MPADSQTPGTAERDGPDALGVRRAPVNRAGLALLGILAAAWAIYRPEVKRPFDFVDFPETLLILQRHDGFFGQFAELTRSLLVHARLNLFVYALIAAKWSLFGWWTPGWQLTRFATMGLVVALSYVLLRRLRLSVAGALAGASVFVIAPAAVRGWIRLTSAEPVALLLLLAAAILAQAWPGTRRKVAVGASIAVLAVLLVWTKEVLAVGLAFPLYLLLTVRPSGELGVPRIDRSNVGVIATTVGAAGLAMIPVLWAYLHAPAASYGHWFGSASPSAFDLLAMAVAGLVPFLPAGKAALGMLLVNVGFWGVLLGGVPLAFQRRQPRRHSAWLLLLAIGLPFLGAALYLPWPNFQLVYAVPFLFGGALLVAMAISALDAQGSAGRWVAAVGWCLVLTYAVPEAVTEARRVEAIQVSTSELLPRVATLTKVDSVFVAAPQAVLDQRGLFGPRLYMYAQATGQPWPPTRDVSCEVASRAAATSPSTVVVWSTFMCGAAQGRGEVIRAGYPRIDWQTLRLARDSMRFDILRAPSSPP